MIVFSFLGGLNSIIMGEPYDIGVLSVQLMSLALFFYVVFGRYPLRHFFFKIENFLLGSDLNIKSIFDS